MVSAYIKKFDYDYAGTEKAMLPLPDPSDISQGMLVNFDDINKEIKRIRKDFDGELYIVLQPKLIKLHFFLNRHFAYISLLSPLIIVYFMKQHVHYR